MGPSRSQSPHTCRSANPSRLTRRVDEGRGGCRCPWQILVRHHDVPTMPLPADADSYVLNDQRALRLVDSSSASEYLHLRRYGCWRGNQHRRPLVGARVLPHDHSRASPTMSGFPPSLHTAARLMLVAATTESLHAGRSRQEELGNLPGVGAHPAWPPGEDDRGDRQCFRACMGRRDEAGAARMSAGNTASRRTLEHATFHAAGATEASGNVSLSVVRSMKSITTPLAGSNCGGA